MYKIIVCLIILSNIAPAFADFTTYTGNGPNYNGFQSKLRINQPKNQISHYTSSRNNRLYPSNCPHCYHSRPYIANGNLNALEKYALNRTFRRESDLERLERLENLAFGATQYGDLHSRYRNVENAILSRPQINPKKNLLNSIANYFNGQATGFTPSLMPYNNLGGFSSNPYNYNSIPGYNNNSFEQYSNGIFGGGWGVSGSDFGTGSSVRILD